MDYNALLEGFAAPQMPYRPMCFWMWNGDITPEGITEQLEDFAERGAGGVFLHPMGESFRLGDFVKGMTPPYLSDEYFTLVRYAAEEARRLGLYLWLYDEGGWPSGSAQGRVVEGHPEFAGRRLHVMRATAVELGELPEGVIAAVGLPEMGIPQPLDLRELAQTLSPYAEVLLFVLKPDGYLIDILKPAAVRRFIDLTHERYREAVGEFFGNTVPGIFTDETSLGGVIGGSAVPWSRDLLEGLTERMGRDARAYLPLLFGPEQVGAEVFNSYSEHEILAARCEYYDLLSSRFGEVYWQQLTRWCEEHGLIHTGHVGGEDNLPDHLHFGHFFRTAGALHAPGVDVIWRQLFPGEENFPFPRLAASAMKRHPLRGTAGWDNLAITECNAVYGFGFHYGQMRWLADYQFQGGINLYAPMATHYTCEGGRLYCTMSHLGPGNPLWPSYGAFAGYIGRLCTLVRNTSERAPVGVYYPVEALWTGLGTDEAWNSLQEVCAVLTSLQIGFDFVDGDLLACATSDGAAAAAGELRYRAIIVPAMLAMSARAQTKAAELAQAGVEVLFLGHWPVQPAEMQGLAAAEEAQRRLQAHGLSPVTAGELEERLSHAHLVDARLKLTDPTPALLMSVRHADNCVFYLLTNDSEGLLEPPLVVETPEPMALEAWDARDGEAAVLLTTAAGVPADLQPVLPPWSTLLLALRPLRPEEELVPPGEPSENEREFARWLADPARRHRHVPHADVLYETVAADAVRPVDEYVIRNGEVEVRTAADGRFDLLETGGELALWQDWGLGDYSGHLEYRFDFTVSGELLEEPVLLDLGTLYWTAGITLNGRELGDSLWAPHTFDISGRLQAGANELRVVVGNTLANQTCREEVVREAQERGWCNTYLQRALPMMQEDLRSGLLGPVRIIISRVRE